MQKKTLKKVLHITPHLGGGIGAAALNYLVEAQKSSDFVHGVVCLDYANKNAIKIAEESRFSLLDNMSKRKSELLGLVADSDIIFVYWWNHPLLYDFLVREKLPANRLIFWSVIVGSPPPNNFTDKILKYPDMFVFSTPLSYKLKDVTNLPRKHKKYLRDVWATGTVDHVRSLKPKKHPGFNIGYMGTVDYAKMHPDFLDMCNGVKIPEAKFIVVGGPNGKQLEQEAKILGIGEKFNFTGFVSEAKKWEHLASFDIFGYPLAPRHYGTCDLALQEAMTVGVVPVVLANPMESYIVKNGVTGIIVKNKYEYVKAIEHLFYNPERRRFLSKNAREYAIKTFSLKKAVSEWSQIFNEVLKLPKTVKKWPIDKKSEDISHKDVFLESLGEYGTEFTSYCDAANSKKRKIAINKIKKLAESESWQSETKSTVHHYRSFFPDDEHLSSWSDLMRNT